MIDAPRRQNFPPIPSRDGSRAMNTDASVAASMLVANGIEGRMCAISQCVAPEVLAAAAAGTNPGRVNGERLPRSHRR
jgi:hypothetical protein